MTYEFGVLKSTGYLGSKSGFQVGPGVFRYVLTRETYVNIFVRKLGSEIFLQHNNKCWPSWGPISYYLHVLLMMCTVSRDDDLRLLFCAIAWYGSYCAYSPVIACLMQSSFRPGLSTEEPAPLFLGSGADALMRLRPPQKVSSQHEC